MDEDWHARPEQMIVASFPRLHGKPLGLQFVATPEGRIQVGRVRASKRGKTMEKVDGQPDFRLNAHGGRSKV